MRYLWLGASDGRGEDDLRQLAPPQSSSVSSPSLAPFVHPPAPTVAGLQGVVTSTREITLAGRVGGELLSTKTRDPCGSSASPKSEFGPVRVVSWVSRPVALSNACTRPLEYEPT